jgi:hypothetical protein
MEMPSVEKVLHDRFRADTHYRNQFETGTSGGSLDRSQRTMAESDLFDAHYHAGTPDAERVKYGCLNPTLRSAGWSSATSYGSSLLFPSSSVARLRTTLTWDDSLGLYNRRGFAQNIATCDHAVHFFLRFDDSLLQSTLCASLGLRDETPHLSVAMCVVNEHHALYIEAQIHGPLSLEHDFDNVKIAYVSHATACKAVDRWFARRCLSECDRRSMTSACR